MKTLFKISIFILFFQTGFSQNPIKEFENGFLKEGQLYGMRKWTAEEVNKMPDVLKPQYFEGGVLVEENEFYLDQDTIYVSDCSGMDSSKCCTRTIRVDYDRSHYLRWHFGRDYQDVYLFNDFLLQDSLSAENIYLFSVDSVPYLMEDIRVSALCPEYEKEFPNLSKKEIIINYIKKKEPKWLTLKEWEIYKQNKKLEQKNNHLFVGENNIGCWYFEAGYYSGWDKMLMESPSTKMLTKRIQKALLERGYDVDVNNIFDIKTKAALVKFQKENGIPVSCFLGPNHLLRELGIEDYYFK